jgi:RES domain-containing protein
VTAADVVSLIDFHGTSRWAGDVWRCHAQTRRYDDWYGSIFGRGGRYNIGEETSRDLSFPALYTAIESGAAILEVARHLLDDDDRETYSRDDVLALFRRLSERTMTQLHVELDRVLDVAEFEIPVDLFTGDSYDVTREIGRRANSAGVEGLIVPSATRLGSNLVILPWNTPFMTHTVLQEIVGLSAIMRA